MKQYYTKILFIFILSIFFSISKSNAQSVTFTHTLTQNGCELGTYDFVSAYLDAMGNPPVPGSVFYHWDFGNGTQSSSVPQTGDANTQRVYIAPGQYNVLLRVYDGPSFADNLLASVIETVTIFTSSTPDFTANQTDGCIPYTVTLTDLTDYTSSPLIGPFISRTWNFGDGNTTTITDPAITTITHTYTNPGDFQITLRVRTSGGRVGEECEGIRVRPAYIRVRHTPVAGFTVNPTPAPCTLPYTPEFTNTSTIPTSPTPAGVITSYIWRFYTDATATTEMSFSPITTTTSAAPTLPAGAYSATGTYAVSLTAISSTGCSNTFTNNSAIVITDPTADFVPNAIAGTCAGDGATFTDNSSDNPVSWNWSFPGATPASSTAQNPTITYNSAGTYNVTLTATYANGCTRVISKPYTVLPLPDATFSVDPVDGYCNAPKTVTFNPNIPDLPGYTYFWNFGETNNAGLNPGPTSNMRSPTNVYELFGNYNVSLTVTDPAGCSQTFVDVLDIIEPNVTIVPRLPIQGCRPLDVTYDFTASAIEPITRYTIDYGDGTTTTVTSPPTPLSVPGNQTHTYTVAGTYTASIEIETINGCIKKVFSALPVQVGEPPNITSLTVVNGGGAGCRGPVSFTPVFPMGVVIDSVSYDFGGGGAPFGTNTAPYNATHVFGQNGTRTITVRAFYNGCPMTLPYTQNITINGPVADLAVVGTQNICTGTNEACFNILGSLPATTGSANTTYTIAFGDGATQTGNLSDMGLGNICHTYSTPASYPVTLTLSDPSGSGCSDNASTTITISTTATVNYDVAPTPAISCSANQVTFTSTSTSSSAGVNIVEYIWDFDDGNIVTLAAPAGSTTTHTYLPRNTPYEPKLSIRLDNGCVYDIANTNVKSVDIQGPIPTITGMPSLLGCTTVPINFEGNATVVPGGNAITNWFWDFGDPASGVNNESSLQNPSHVFTSPGTYTVTLRVKDNNTLTSGTPVTPGCEAIVTATVQVFEKPTVSFTNSQTIPCVGSAIDFNLTTNAGAGATYAWDFGDGGTSTDQNPTYAFDASTVPLGTSLVRTVSVTVTSVNGCATTLTKNITVANPSVVITANGSTTPITVSCPPSTVNFTSTIEPAIIAGSGWTYQWNFGDGNQANTPNATNDYIAPNAPSIFDVTFTATNTSTGCSVTRNLTAFVTINGPRGTFDFNPKIICYPQTVTFELTSSSGSPTQIEWDYGDGTTSGPLALPGGATHTYTYTKSGNFLPIMTLFNSSNCKVGYPSTVGRVLSSGPPNANFTWTGGSQICKDVTVNFTDLSSPDPLTNPGSPLDPDVNRWTWTIFDGNNTATDPILAVYNNQNPSHIFTDAKTYTVRLEVRSAFNQGGTPDGCPDVIEQDITIVEPNITATITSITPAELCPGEPVNFQGTGTTSVTPNTLTYQWRFFESVGGAIEADTTGALVGTLTGPNVTFPFPNPGTYVAKLVVTDVALCTGGAVATTRLTVDPLPTFAPSSGPNDQSICVTETASFSVIASASALVAPGVTYQWQVNDGGGWANISNGPTLGGAIYSGVTTDNLMITNGSVNLDNYQYRAIITKQNTTQCTATSTSATLTVNQNATVAMINPPVNPEVCDITTYTLSANTPTIGTGTWTKLAGSPAGGTITNPNDPNSTITSLQYGLYTYRWTISNGVCPATFADFTIRNVRPADAGTDQNLCVASSFTLTGNDPVASGHGAGSTGMWSFISGPNTPIIADATNFTTTVTNIVTSSIPYVFRWQVTGTSACGVTNDQVQIFNYPNPSFTGQPTDLTVCSTQNATFTVNGSASLNYQWQVDDGGGSGFVNLADAGVYSGTQTTTLTITGATIALDQNRYRAVATNPTTNCESNSNEAELRIITTPNNIVNVDNTDICAGDPVTITVFGTDNGYTYVLRDGTTPVAGVSPLTGTGGDLSFATFNPTTTTTYNVLVTTSAVNGSSCEVQLANTPTVNVVPATTVANAGTDITTCATMITLNANADAGASETGTWIQTSGTTATITDANDPNTTVTGLADGTSEFTWTIVNNAGTCPPTSDPVTVTKQTETTADAGANQTICGNATVLAGNTPASGTGTWVKISGPASTIVDINDPNSALINVALGTHVFEWQLNNGLCTPSTDQVTIIREPATAFSDAGANQEICIDNTTLLANTPASGSGTWTQVAGTPATITNVTDPNTTVTGLAMGTSTFQWTVTNPCATAISTVDITVNNPTATANAGADFDACGSTATLNATAAPSGQTGEWTVVSGGATVTDANDPNSGVINLGLGTNTFRWRITNGVCPTTEDLVVITRLPEPTANITTADQSVCADVTTYSENLDADALATGLTGTWTVVAGTGTFASTTSNNTTVSGLSYGINQFRWTVTNGNINCTDADDVVTITVSEPVTANASPDNANICGDISSIINLTGNTPPTGATGIWTASSGSINFGNVNNATTTITNIPVGTHTITWTVTRGSCTASANFTISRAEQPTGTTANATTNTLCGDASSVINISGSAVPTGMTGQWTASNPSINFGDATVANTTVTNLPFGTHTITWTISNGICTDDASFTITLEEAITGVTATTPQATLCGDVTTSISISGSTVPTGATGVWTASDASINFGNANANNTTITNVPFGTHTITWTVTRGSCPPVAASFTITLEEAPPVVTATTPQTTVCGASTDIFTISGTPAPAGMTGTWTASSGSISFGNVNLANTTITNLPFGTHTITWTVTNGTCPSSSASFNITLQSLPTTTAGANQTICGTTTVLDADNLDIANGETGIWTVEAGTGTFVDATDPKSGVSGLTLNATNRFRWTVSKPGCTAVSAIVDVVTLEEPTTNAGLDETICGTTTTLDADNLNLGNSETGVWTVEAGTGTFADDTDPKSGVSGLTADAVNTFRWTVTRPNCPPVSDVVNITTLIAPVANAGIAQTVCGTTTTLDADNLNLANGETGLWTVEAGTGTFVDATDPKSAVTGLTVGITNTFRWTVSKTGCPDASSTVDINTLQQPVTDAGAAQTICGTTTTLDADNLNLGNGETGIWTVVSGTGTFANATDPKSGISGLTAGATNTFRWTVSKTGCSDVSDVVTITTLIPPTANAGAVQTVCGVTTTLDADPLNLGNGETGLWTVEAGTGTFSDATDPKTSVSGLTAGITNTFRWTVSKTGCPDATSTVDINTLIQPTANAGLDATVCGDVTALNAVALNTTNGETGLWTVEAGTGTFADATDPNTGVTGLTVNAVNRFRWTVSKTGCPDVSDVVEITTLQQPVVDAGPNQTAVCATTTLLDATALNLGNGESGVWTVEAGAGTFTDPNDPKTSVTGLTVGVTNTFRWTVTKAGCSDVSDVVNITTIPEILATVDADFAICDDESVINATATNGTGTWTAANPSITFDDINSGNTVVRNLAVGLNTLTWTVSNGGTCPNEVRTLIITREENPTLANAGADAETCDGTATLNATAVTVGTGTWTLESGTGTIVSPNDANTAITGLGLGANTFRWTTSNASCPTTTDLVTITRLPDAVANITTTDQTLCQDVSTYSTTLNADAIASGLTGEWTVIAGTGTFGTSTSNNTTVTGLSYGVNQFRWRVITSSATCPVSEDVVTITISEPVTANASPDNSNICGDLSSIINLTGNTAPTGATGQWSSSNASIVFGNINDATTTITNIPVGTHTIEWTVTRGSCTDVASFSVTRTEQPTGVTASTTDAVVCGDASTSINITGSAIPSGMTGQWTASNGSITFGDVSNPNTTISNLPFGTHTITWTVSNGACTDNASFPITLDEVITGVTANLSTVTSPLCSDASTVISISGSALPTGATGQWTASDASITFADASSASTTMTNLPYGTHTITWTVSRGVTCPAVSANFVVTIEEAPPTSITASTPDNVVCGTNTSVFNITGTTIPTGMTGQWTSTTAGITFGDASNPNTTITNLPFGTHTIMWTLSNGTCPSSSANFNITLEEAPPISITASATNSVECGTITDVFNITGTAVPAGMTGQWTSSNASIVFGSTSSANTTITNLPFGTHTITWTLSNGTCPSSTANFNITLEEAPPTSITASATNSVECGSSTDVFNITGTAIPTGMTGQWTASDGSIMFGNVNNPNTTITNLPFGTHTITWTLSNGTCPSSSANFNITLEEAPPVSVTASTPDNVVCGTNASIFNITGTAIPTGMTGQWTSSNASIVFADAMNPNTTITNLPFGTHTITWTLSNGICPSSDGDFSIILEQEPTTSAAGADQNVCTATATLAGNTAMVGTGVWTVTSGTASIDSPTSPNSGVSGLVAGSSATFRWTISNGTCPISFDEITITRDAETTVANAGANQNVCDATATLAGNTPSVGTGMWTLVSGTASIDSPTSPNSGVSGLVSGSSATFRWTISNGTCMASTDEVTITRDENPTTALAGTDQNVCDATATLNGNLPSVGTGMWTVISGSATIDNPSLQNSGISGLASGTSATFRWTISNGTCVTSTDDVTITRDENPTMALAGTDQNVCDATATLAGNTATVGTGMWTLVSGTGTIDSPTNPNSTVSGLISGSSATFRWTISNGTCPASTDDVTITRDENPSIAGAGADQNVCTSTATLLGNTPVVGTGVWTLVSGTGNVDNPTNPNTTVSGLISGSSATFRWTISNGTCMASTDDVTITRDENPTMALAGTDQNVCDATATLTGNTATVGTGMWTLVSGTGTVDNPTNPNSGVSGLVSGSSATFRWTISNGTCPVSFDEVTITRDVVPTIANAGANQNVCTGTATLNGNLPSIGTGMWTVISGSATIDNPSLQNSGISGLASGTSATFRWTISNGTCPASFDDVIITRDVEPTVADAGVNQNVCDATATLAGNTATVGTGMWTLVSGTGTIDSPTSPNSGVSGLISGSSATFRWTISNGTCPVSTDDVTITRDENPTMALAGTDQNVCDATATLAGNTATVGTGMWTLVSGTGTIDSPTNPNSGVSGLVSGSSATFRWTISNGTCPTSTDDVTITRDENPTVASAGTDQSVCIATATLSGNTPMVGTGVWTLVSGIGTIDSPTNPNSGVSGLVSGSSATFRWTISNGTCPVSTDDIIITRDVEPTIAVAGADQNICATTAILAGNTPAIGAGQWTVIAGTATVDNPTLPNSTVSGLSVGVNTFRWTISNGTCTDSFDEITVTRSEEPTVANAGLDQEICATSIVLNGNTPSVGTGTWTQIAGTGIIANPNDPNTLVSNLGAGVNTFRWTVANGTCTNSTDLVTITRNEEPTIANAGANQTVCVATVTLNGNTPMVGTGFWTLTTGTGVITDPTQPNTTVTGLALGTNTFTWTITNGNCPASTSTVTVTREENPTVANAGANQIICATSTTLGGNTPVVGSGTWTLVSGSGVIANPTNPNTTVSNLGAGDNIFRWEIANVCGFTQSNVTITRFEEPTVSNAGINQTLCATTAVLSANTPTVGTGQWTLVSGSGSFVNPNDANTAVTGLAVGDNIFRWTISNGTCPTSISIVTITREDNPTIANAGSNQTICNTGASLNGNAPIVGTGQWTVTSGTGTVDNPSDPSSTVSNLSVGANTFTWTITNGTCPPSSDAVTITREAVPTTSDAGANQTICATTTNLAGNNPVIGTGTWTVLEGGASVDDPSNPTSSITGLTVGTNRFMWTIANGTCPSSTDIVTIIREEEPTTAIAGTSQTVCTDIVSLTANTPTVGVGQWTVIAGSGAITNPNNPNTTVTGLGLGVNTFRWTISNGTCTPSFANVNIIREIAPTTADAGADQNVCLPNATLAGNTPINGIGTWSIVSGSGTITNVNSPNSGVTGLGVGTNTFKWTITNGTCTPSEAFVNIIRDEPPTTADAGVNQVLCTATTTLNANTPMNGTGTWTLISGAGVVTNTNSPTTGVTGLGVGDNIFRWTIANACGTSTANVVITREEAPTVSNAGLTQTICSETTNLNGNMPTVGTGVWTTATGIGIVVNPNSPTSTVLNLSPGANIFTWTITNGTCPPSVSSVTIFRDEEPTTANAGLDQEICNGSTVTLTANNPTIGIGNWIQVSGPTIATITSTNTNITDVINLTNGTYIFRWTISNGTCTDSQDEVTVQVLNEPNSGTNLVVSDLEYCSQEVPTTIDITVTNTESGIDYELRDGTNILSNITSGGGLITFTVPAPSTSTDYEVYAINSTISGVSCPAVALADKSVITVINCNLPTPVNLTRTTDYCTTLTVNVLDGVDLSIFNTTPVSNFVTANGGIVNINSTGIITYEPLTNFVGTDVFTYEVCNNETPVDCANGQITVLVEECTNETPIANTDNFSVFNCEELTGNVLDNDTDDAGGSLTVTEIPPTLTSNGGIVQINTNGEFIYSPDENFVGTDSIVYQICDDGDGSIVKCDEAVLYVNVLDCETVYIPDGFSPNGDGINDFFKIEGNQYFEISLKVYNRWGQLVYESEDYLDDWNGVANRGALSGRELPDGTYYYVADLNNGAKPKAKYLIIRK